MRIDTFLSSPRIGFQDEAAEFDFFPMTFTLPSEGQMFLRAFHESGGVWIMKPIGRAQGKGIFLVNKASQIESWLRVRLLVCAFIGSINFRIASS